MSEQEKNNRIVAFVCGIPDKCNHDIDGERMYFNDEFKTFKESELPKERNARLKFMQQNELFGQSHSCSKCKKPHLPTF